MVGLRVAYGRLRVAYGRLRVAYGRAESGVW